MPQPIFHASYAQQKNAKYTCNLSEEKCKYTDITKKNKHKKTFPISQEGLFFGRSGEIRTRGLLNPIGRECLPARASTPFSGVLRGKRTLECLNCDFEVQFVYPMARNCLPQIDYTYYTILCCRSQQIINNRTREQRESPLPSREDGKRG